jgi:hypothetical protein
MRTGSYIENGPFSSPLHLGPFSVFTGLVLRACYPNRLPFSEENRDCLPITLVLVGPIIVVVAQPVLDYGDSFKIGAQDPRVIYHWIVPI